MSNLINLVQDEFIGAWNAHDADKLMGLFADDVIVTIDPPFPGAPPVFNGKAEAQGFVGGFISGIRVDAHNYRESANHVTFDATVSADATRMLGVEGVEQTDDVEIRDGKVAAFTIHISESSHAKLTAGAAALGAS